jgi:hypothetical protein
MSPTSFTVFRLSSRPGAAALFQCALVAGMFCLGSVAGAAELKAVKIGSRIDVTIGGDFFTSYRFSADEKYPFFFPVNGPSGASVTSMRNGKFPHHSSLFSAATK